MGPPEVEKTGKNISSCGFLQTAQALPLKSHLLHYSRKIHPLFITDYSSMIPDILSFNGFYSQIPISSISCLCFYLI